MSYETRAPYVAPLPKYKYSKWHRYSGESFEGKKYKLRSSYRISGKYEDYGKFCFKEECSLDGSTSILKGQFKCLPNRIEGKYYLIESCKISGTKSVLRSKYHLDEGWALHGEYSYFEKFKYERSKIFLRGNYVIDGYSNQIVQHFITQDTRRIGIQGQGYVSRVRSLAPEETGVRPTSGQFGSEPGLYQVPLEYNVWVDHRFHPIRRVSMMYAAVPREVSRIMQRLRRNSSMKTESHGHQIGADPSDGIVARTTERLERAAGIQGTVLKISSNVSRYPRMTQRPSAPAPGPQSVSAPDLRSTRATNLPDPEGPPPSYDNLFNRRYSIRDRLDKLLF